MSYLSTLRQKFLNSIQYKGSNLTSHQLEELLIQQTKQELKTNPLYLPLPELGIEDSHRSEGSWLKWAAIKPNLNSDVGSALDVGCSNGFFSFRLAEAGMMVFGIEQNRTSIKFANLAAKTAEVEGISFMYKRLEPASLPYLPKVDYVIFMSVFQQWVVNFGYSQALDMLRILWTKAQTGMFFETAETYSCKKEYAEHLPYMGETPESCMEFVANMLQELDDTQVTCLGYFPTNYRSQESRHLFFIKRISE